MKTNSNAANFRFFLLILTATLSAIAAVSLATAFRNFNLRFQCLLAMLSWGMCVSCLHMIRDAIVETTERRKLEREENRKMLERLKREAGGGNGNGNGSKGNGNAGHGEN